LQSTWQRAISGRTNGVIERSEKADFRAVAGWEVTFFS
jgi:hypothetical protein